MYHNKFNQHKKFGRKMQQKSLPRHELMQAIQSVEVIKRNKVIEENPIVTGNFEDFGLSQAILQNVVSKGYTSPTPIQIQTIPAIISGRDVIGIANTGTGKTAAFLIHLVK